MPALLSEILLILLLIIANGVFSGSEIAVVSSRKARLEQMARHGDVRARAALKLANAPNNFLSAVQVGITLIGILSGAVGGAALAEHLQPLLALIPALAPYSAPLSVGIVVTAITYLSLVIGELVPKRIALNDPERIASIVAKPMRFLAKFTAPIVYLLDRSTEGVLRLFKIQAMQEQPVTEEEIKVLIEQGARAGAFEVVEQQMVSRVFRLNDRPIRSLMTPRREVTWLDLEDPLQVNQQLILGSPHSRFPVAQRTLDDCLGIVSVKDLWSIDLTGAPVDFQQILQPASYVPEATPALDVLEMFRQTATKMILVTDEYGGIEGLVTLRDLTEAIVGSLPGNDIEEEPQIVQREDGSWLLDGLLSVDELKALLKRETLPLEEETDYQTLGGLMMSVLERIPHSGDRFEADGWCFEVVDMDGNRVDKVLVTPTASEETNAEEAEGSGI